MTRAVKGNFGYIRAKRLAVLIRTIVFFGISLSLFAAGCITTGKKENLLTIVAVLGCLPACKSMVNTVMLFRARGCSDQARDAIKPLEGRLIGMYDMYFTSYQKNFALSHMVVEGNLVLGYTESGGCDCTACQEHLQAMLRQGGFKDRTITISQSLSKYCEQLKNLNQMTPSGSPEKDDEVRVVLYDISL
mgnify:CR=1 FL=1